MSPGTKITSKLVTSTSFRALAMVSGVNNAATAIFEGNNLVFTLLSWHSV